MSEDITEKNETTATPTDVKTNLKELFETNLNIYAHGTRVESAGKIMQEGLRSKCPDLSGAAINLFDHETPFESQIDGILETMKKWPHLESKAIIIIALPTLRKTPSITTPVAEISAIRRPLGMQAQSRTASFLHEVQGTGYDAYDLPYILPVNYIRGYVNVETNEFIKNPLFNPTPPEPTINQDRDTFISEIPTKPVNSASPEDILP